VNAADAVGAGLPGWWATEVPGWPWNLRPGPYQGPATGYAQALDVVGAEVVFVRHRIGLGTGACRFASRVVVPAATTAAFPAVAVGPYRRLRDLEAVLVAGGCRLVPSTVSHRAIVGADLAGLFGVPTGSTCHRVTITLHHPDTRAPLALSDHLSAWTTRPTATPASGRASPTVTATRTPRNPPPHRHR
jgi:hypothetical protein